MTTDEEKALTELLLENLENDDLVSPEPPIHHETHPVRKNRRWRQLHLKIKFIAGAFLFCAILLGVFLYVSPLKSSIKASVPSGTPSSEGTSPENGTGSQKTPNTAAVTGTATPTPTPTPSPTPVPVSPTPTPAEDHTVTQSSEWNLILVNKWNSLPDDFSVEVESVENGHSVDARIAQALNNMLAAARAEGLSPMICSSYRTNEKQESLHNNKVKEYLSQGYSEEDAESEAGKWVAFPGTSEHQTGLAVDLVASSYQMLNEKQEETAEQKWLMENSYKYGFILRYPNDKRDITGIYYEPWHYRYVGLEAAKEIYEQDICLEEYLANKAE